MSDFTPEQVARLRRGSIEIAGKAAAQRGDPLSANPHIDPQCRAFWEAGWRSVRRENAA